MPILSMPVSTVFAPILAAAPAGPAALSTWASRLTGGPLPAWIAPALACAGILLGLVIIMLQIRSDRARRAGGRAISRAATPVEPATPAARPGASFTATSAAAETTALREVMRDAEDLMDQLASRAEAQADRLEKLMAKAGEAQEQLAAVERRLAETVKQAEEAEQRASSRAAAVSNAAVSMEAKPRPRDGLADSHRGVYELADQGLSVTQIAKRLDQPTGEVELILSLRRM